MPKFLKWFLMIWFPLAFVILCVGLLSYGLVQQTLRQDANDPQIQLAEDVANLLDNGRTPDSLVNGIEIKIDKSLSPFIIIYDTDGKVLATSATLNDKPVDVPVGVLTNAKDGSENKVTWEPAKNIRSAIVVAKYSGGYVVAGRSLREVEIRENYTMWATVIAVLVMLIGSAMVLAATMLLTKLLSGKKLAV